jgi:hypothetical protein
MLSSAFDPDRQVRTAALTNWQALLQHISLDDFLESLFDALTSTILEEAEAVLQTSGVFFDESDIAAREAAERMANHLSTNIEAYTYLLGQCRPEQECDCEAVISSPGFWRLLLSVQWPPIRRAIWKTLARLLATAALQQSLNVNARMICAAVMPAIWSERDFTTQNTMWPVVVDLLTAYPQAWYTSSNVEKNDASSAASSDSDDSSSQSSSSLVEEAGTREKSSRLVSNVQSYLSLLQLGFYGNATTGYKSMPAVIRTIPNNYLGSSSEALQLFYASFWAAYTGRALLSSGPAGLTAFASACVHSISFHLLASEESSLQTIALDQLALLWQYLIGAISAPSRTTSLSRMDCVPIVQRGLTSAAEDAPSLFQPFAEQMQRSAMIAAEQGTVPPSLFAETVASLCKSPAVGISELGLAIERSLVEESAKPGSPLATGNVLRALLDVRGTAVFDSARNRDVSEALRHRYDVV